LHHIHGTKSTVQICFGINGPDLIVGITISHVAVSWIWGRVVFKIWTPNSRNPEISSHHIPGTGSTVPIYFGISGPDLIDEITISHFTISWLRGITTFKIWSPNIWDPEISSHPIHGIGSTVHISFGFNGSYLVVDITISHFMISCLWGIASFKIWTLDSWNPEISSVLSMGPDRRSWSLLVPMVLICSFLSRFHHFGKQHPLILWIPIGKVLKYSINYWSPRLMLTVVLSLEHQIISNLEGILGRWGWHLIQNGVV
jgi:hypothetical protein